MRHRPVVLALGAISALAGTLALAGCPGSIDDPAPFRAHVDTSCPPSFDVERDLFRRTCGQLACHTGGPTLAAAGLDLSAPGVGARLMAHTSTECDDRPLIDPGQLDASYLISKVDDDEPACGDRMPQNLEPLNGTERRCLELYLEALVGPSTGDAGIAPSLDGGS